MAAPIIPILAVIAGIGALVYFSREQGASASPGAGGGTGGGGGGGGGTGTGAPPGEPIFVASVADHDAMVAKTNANPKPVVLIVFKAPLIGSNYDAITQAAQTAAYDFGTIWVIVETEAMAANAEGAAYTTDILCAPDDIGFVLAKQMGAAEIKVNCWDENVTATNVRQDILAAAVVANGLVGTS